MPGKKKKVLCLVLTTTFIFSAGCAVLPYAFLAGIGGVAGYHISKHRDEISLKKEEPAREEKQDVELEKK